MARIGDYGKLKYDLAKKDKEARKSAKSGTLKEVKLSPKIADHDFNVRLEKTKELLARGHKVKATIMFRGREMAHVGLGRVVLDRLIAAIGEHGKADAPSKMEGKNLFAILSPIKK